jgi:antitoxin MazE
MNTIKTRIVKIGNSRGIRIPKLLLDQTGFGEEVELELQDNSIVIRASHSHRYGWEERFKMMAEQGDDQLLDEQLQLSSWDDEDWEW